MINGKRHTSELDVAAWTLSELTFRVFSTIISSRVHGPEDDFETAFTSHDGSVRCPNMLLPRFSLYTGMS